LVENVGPNPASAVTLTVAIQGMALLGSVISTSGNYQISSNEVVCRFGDQTVNSTNTLTIEFAQAPSGTVFAVATVSSTEVDTNPGDNTSLLLFSTPPRTSEVTTFSLPIPVNDLVTDPVRGGLFLAINGSVPNWGDGIVYFDPITGQFSHALHVGPNVGPIAISKDGQVLYAASTGRLHKIATPSLELVSEFPLIQNDSATALAVFPNDPEKVAVWHQTPPDLLGQTNSDGLAVYAAGQLIGRAELPGPWRQVAVIDDGQHLVTFGPSGGVVIDQFSVGSSGLTRDFSINEPLLSLPGPQGTPVEAKYASGRIYSENGWVYDVRSRRLSGTCYVSTYAIPGNTLVERDPATGTIFYLKFDRLATTRLSMFDPDTYQEIRNTPVWGLAAPPTHLVRWGNDGLAFKTSDGRLFVARDFLVGIGPEPKIKLTVTGPTSAAKMGAAQPYSVTITNDGPGTALGLRAAVFVNVPAVSTNLLLSGGSLNPDGSWSVGDLEPGAGATLTLEFTPQLLSPSVDAVPLMFVQAAVESAISGGNVSLHLASWSQRLHTVGESPWVTAMPIPVSLLVSDGTNLYASLGMNNSIVKVRPDTAEIAASLFVGSNPGAMAVSSDASRLYVALDGESAIRQIDLRNFQAGSSFSISNGATADRILGVPGSPDTVVVHRPNFGLSVYKQGIELPDSLSIFNGFAFSDTTGELFAYNKSNSDGPLYRLSLNSSGLSTAAPLGISMPIWNHDPVFGGGQLYLSSGRVFAPATDKLAQFLPLGTARVAGVQPMPEYDRVFYLVSDANGTLLLSFALSTGLPAGTFVLPSIGVGPLCRWGPTGLAFGTGGGLVILHNPFLGQAPGTDLAIEPIQASVQTGYPKVVTCTGTITNRSNVLAEGVAGILSFSGYYQQAQVSMGTFQTNYTEVLWNAGDLPPHSSAQITLQFEPGGSAVACELQAVSTTFDPVQVNNAARIIITVPQPSTNASITSFDLAATDLVYDKPTGQLWFSVTDDSFGAAVVPMDPVTGRIGPAIDVASEPGKLVLDADNQHLNVLLPSAAGIAQVSTVSGRLERFASLGFDPVTGFRTPLDLAAAPDKALRVAVSYQPGPGPIYADVVVIDDGVSKPLLGQSPEPGDLIEFSAAGDRIYGISSLFAPNSAIARPALTTYGVNNSGATYLNNTTNALAVYSTAVKRAGKLLYTSRGEVLDPQAQVLVTNLSSRVQAVAVEPSTEDNRIYYAATSPNRIEVVNLTNYASLGNIPLADNVAQIKNLVRWGIDGLAALTIYSAQALLFRSSLVPVPVGQDTDGDGMPDWWESRYGLNPYDPADAGVDSDGDAQANLAEYLSGTDPTDPTSVLKVQGVSVQGTNLIVVFPSVSGKRYQLEAADALPTTHWASVGGIVVGTDRATTNQVPDVGKGKNNFLRIRLVQ
jgi:hypothetical protein